MAANTIRQIIEGKPCSGFSNLPSIKILSNSIAATSTKKAVRREYLTWVRAIEPTASVETTKGTEPRNFRNWT